MARRHWSKSIAWIALVIAIAAFVLAWLAFSQSGANLNQLVEQEVQESTADIRANLEALRENQIQPEPIETDDRDTATTASTDNTTNTED